MTWGRNFYWLTCNLIRGVPHWIPSERSAAAPLQRVSCTVFRTDRGSQQLSASLPVKSSYPMLYCYTVIHSSPIFCGQPGICRETPEKLSSNFVAECDPLLVAHKKQLIADICRLRHRWRLNPFRGLPKFVTSKIFQVLRSAGTGKASRRADKLSRPGLRLSNAFANG